MIELMDAPDREKEVANRLRHFRETLKIPRAAFALSVGIGSERLASYESGRVPLRYGVFLAISKLYRLRPYWLATGITEMMGEEPFDDTEFQGGINPKDTFTKVFDEVLREPLQHKKYDELIELRRMTWKIRKLNETVSALDTTVPDYIYAVDLLTTAAKELVAKLGEIRGRLSSADAAVKKSARQKK